MNNLENEVLSANPALPTSGPYETVRYNAMTHGILSKHAVLPHEDKVEFNNLLSALKAEHQPAGMTEMHLVEELATILWRKRRVLLAEGASINRNLRQIASQTDSSIVPAAVPFDPGLKTSHLWVTDIICDTPEENQARLHEAELDLAATEKAAAILRKGGKTAYARARNALIPESRDMWDDYVEDEEYPATAQGLADFINDRLRPICLQMQKEARYYQEIKAQTLGEGLRAQQLEKLNRYEVHLDRKFERTLAMLLRLKDLRGPINPNP
ncbi:hypothetical protein HC024_04575 [Methylococcaceae bacterium WWC4]|nr:hypothetical protein [Methylococcaceae bacterium WWC4]